MNEGKTIGEMLRAAREARKLSIEQVTQETKISTQTVRALEQDDFGAFSSETYLKGFLRTYANFLGVDFGRLWSLMGQRTQAPAAGPVPSWEIESVPREEKLGPPRWIRRLLLPVLLLVILVLAILLVRERGRSRALQTGLGGPAAAAPLSTG